MLTKCIVTVPSKGSVIFIYTSQDWWHLMTWLTCFMVTVPSKGSVICIYTSQNWWHLMTWLTCFMDTGFKKKIIFKKQLTQIGKSHTVFLKEAFSDVFMSSNVWHWQHSSKNQPFECCSKCFRQNDIKAS